jgi:hypothetical protein
VAGRSPDEAATVSRRHLDYIALANQR